MNIQKTIFPALRVAQLDTTELDDNVLQLLSAQLQWCFKYKIWNYDLMQYEPHIRAVMHGLLLYFTLWKSNQTIGQTLLGLRYGDKQTLKTASSRQLIFIQTILVLSYWLKSANLAGRIWISKVKNFELLSKFVESLLDVCSLLNFLLFLRHGHFHTPLLRIAGLRTVYVDENPPPREITHDVMRRELLWHGFAETGVFFLSLINLGKLRRKVFQVLLPRSETDFKENWDSCAFCKSTPVMPYEGACGRHAYCYYCVSSVITNDDGAKCPACGDVVGIIRPLRLQRNILKDSQTESYI